MGSHGVGESVARCRTIAPPGHLPSGTALESLSPDTTERCSEDLRYRGPDRPPEAKVGSLHCRETLPLRSRSES